MEAELFIRIYEELINTFRNEYKNYFRFINVTIEMENVMLEESLLRLVINDILLTEDYTLDGITTYTATHQDILQDIILGRNLNPSINLFRRMVALHRVVRNDLYQKIIRKIKVELCDELTLF